MNPVGSSPGRRPARRIVSPIAGLALLILAASLAACGGGGKGGQSDQAPSTPPAVDAAAAASGHGLLLPRDQRLLVRNMEDSTEKVLKRAPPDLYYTYPRWSPDGKQIAYALDLPYTGQPNQQWGSDIVLMAANGSGERTIVKRPAAGFKVEGLAWSADGAALYAGVVETTIKDGRFVSQVFRVERIDLVGGARTPIVPEATYPTAAADGSRIAYITYGEGDTPGGVWVARPDGSDRKLLVPATGKFAAVYYPRFSPDSKTIAFSAATLGQGAEPGPSVPSARSWPRQPPVAAAHGFPMDVWAVSVDGGEPRRLTNFLEDEPYPAWSPDGGQLAIIATGGLYTVPAAGGDPKKIGLGGTLVQIDWR